MKYLVYLPLVIGMLVFLVFYYGGKRKYQQYVEALDKKDFSLKDFMPFGFYAMEKINYQYGNNIDRMLRRQLAELYDQEYVEFYVRAIWAQAVTNGAIGLIFGFLLFAAMDGDFTLLGIGFALMILLSWASFQEVKKKVDQRHLQIAMDLPDLTNQIIILSGAGMTLKGALIKISTEMKIDTPLYQALAKAVEKMSRGMPDEVAIDTITTLCNTPEVRRFTSVILQNMQRGGTEVLIALQDIGRELWEMRKATARRMAEETSTKLLFPMMLMLLAVILLVAAPAVIGMGI